jgi:hypothetical protein
LNASRQDKLSSAGRLKRQSAYGEKRRTALVPKDSSYTRQADLWHAVSGKIVEHRVDRRAFAGKGIPAKVTTEAIAVPRSAGEHGRVRLILAICHDMVVY